MGPNEQGSFEILTHACDDAGVGVSRESRDRGSIITKILSAIILAYFETPLGCSLRRLGPIERLNVER
jgi:hypothetical protein